MALIMERPLKECILVIFPPSIAGETEAQTVKLQRASPWKNRDTNFGHWSENLAFLFF